MATGRYVTDLDQGDVLGPLEYTMSKFVVREYCHANELHQDCFQNDVKVAPPTLVHLDKLRLYKHACPAGTGPTPVSRPLLRDSNGPSRPSSEPSSCVSRR